MKQAAIEGAVWTIGGEQLQPSMRIVDLGTSMHPVTSNNTARKLRNNLREEALPEADQKPVRSEKFPEDRNGGRSKTLALTINGIRHHVLVQEVN